MPPNPPIQFNIQASLPVLAYIGGLLLPDGAFALDHSKLEPGKANLVVHAHHPGIPARVIELLEEAAQGRQTPELWARVLSPMNVQVGGAQVPILMELQITQILRTRPNDEQEQPATEA